jgi:thioredoxin 1
MFAPTYGAASERHPEITFTKVDTEAEQGLAAAAGITSIPTLMAFRDKTLVFSQPGALNATGLEEVIQEVKNLDVAQLRAQAAQQQN